MARLNMKGPFELTNESIDSNVKDKTHGNYALGRLNENGTFIVQYVGRADNGLIRRLKEHTPESYDYFKYSTCTSEEEAFKEECRNWHDFGGEEGKMKNERHPKRPDGETYSCPYCNEYDEG